MAKISVQFTTPNTSSDVDLDRYGISVSTLINTAVSDANTFKFATGIKSGIGPGQVVSADIFELFDGTDLILDTPYWFVISTGDASGNFATDFTSSEATSAMATAIFEQEVIDSGVIVASTSAKSSHCWTSQPYFPAANPLLKEPYFKMDVNLAPTEAFYHDCNAADYIAQFGKQIKVFPVSKYHLTADAVFGEDKLKEYGPVVIIKAIWEPTQEVQMFGQFDIQNIDEITLQTHIGTTSGALGRNIQVGDWFMTPHNCIIYEVVKAKAIEFQHLLGKFFTTVIGLPRLVSNERGLGTTPSHAPPATSGYFTEVPKSAITKKITDVTITDSDEQTRKSLWGGW